MSEPNSCTPCTYRIPLYFVTKSEFANSPCISTAGTGPESSTITDQTTTRPKNLQTGREGSSANRIEHSPRSFTIGVRTHSTRNIFASAINNVRCTRITHRRNPIATGNTNNRNASTSQNRNQHTTHRTSRGPNHSRSPFKRPHARKPTRRQPCHSERRRILESQRIGNRHQHRRRSDQIIRARSEHRSPTHARANWKRLRIGSDHSARALTAHRIRKRQTQRRNYRIEPVSLHD